MTRWLVGLLAFLCVVVLGAWLARLVATAEPPEPALELSAAPISVTVDPERLAAALEESPWVSNGGEGRTLWVIGHRSCAGCVSYLRAEASGLADAGVDVRVVFFAPDDAGPAERAVLAEIGARRDWNVLRGFIEADAASIAARESIPPASDPVRAAIVAAGRRTRDEAEAVMAANGYAVVYPLLLWRDPDGGWRAVTGDTDRGRRAVRAALTGE